MRVLTHLKPTTILLPHPADNHPDHAATAQFDGTKRISEIAASLAKEYDEKAEIIRADIDNLLKDLAAKGYVKP